MGSQDPEDEAGLGLLLVVGSDGRVLVERLVQNCLAKRTNTVRAALQLSSAFRFVSHDE